MDKVLEITSNDHIIMIDKLCKRILGHPEILGRIIKGFIKEAKEDKSIPHHDCCKKVFTRGDILVVNDNLAHYRGELEVVLTEIPNDGERNLIGKIKDEDLGLLDFIKPGQHFKFIK